MTNSSPVSYFIPQIMKPIKVLLLSSLTYLLRHLNFQKVAEVLRSGQEKETNEPHIQSMFSHVYPSLFTRLV